MLVGSRTIAPSLFGSSYSWSLTNIKGIKDNKNALGFPLNQYFVFFLLSMTAFITAFIASKVPTSLNNIQPDEVNSNCDEGGNKSKKVTNISISYFTPASGSY